ncbi:MAG: SemiSWEET transporter [bacterium]|nr:SemiSWEET transporter [bacterium]
MNEVSSIGFLAAIFTTTSFIPQVIKAIRTKSAKDLSLIMYIILLTGQILWLSYGILTHSYPLIIGNSITTVLASIILFLRIKY